MATTLAKDRIFDELRSQIVGIDQQVPLLDGSSTTYAYLDNAASTPALGYVQRKVDLALGWYSSVHRGTGYKSLISTQAYEQAREIVTKFVGADPQSDVVIFGKNTSEAVNQLANAMAFGPEDVVLTTTMEHHSDDLPWRAKARVEHVAIQSDGCLDLDDLRARLERNAGKVRLVAVTGASNVTGFLPPLYDIAVLAHEHGAYIFADCAQLAAHRNIHMGPVGSPRRLDFIAISAHKMYAPFGTGALIGPRSFFEQGPPDYRGGGTIEVVTLDEVHWAGAPERGEVGSPNVLGAIALAASIQELERVGMDAIAGHEAELTSYALEKLNAMPDITLYGATDPRRIEDRIGVVSFQVAGVSHAKVAAILGFEGGIGVRNGCFCAHPYVNQLLAVEKEEFERFRDEALQGNRSRTPGMVRMSFGCYNTREEVDRVLDMLTRIITGNILGEYEIDLPSGAYYPRGFQWKEMQKVFDR